MINDAKTFLSIVACSMTIKELRYAQERREHIAKRHIVAVQLVIVKKCMSS